MPRQNTRWTIRRHVDQGVHHMDRAYEYIQMAASHFETQHPDYYEALYHVAAALENTKKALLDIKEMI